MAEQHAVAEACGPLDAATRKAEPERLVIAFEVFRRRLPMAESRHRPGRPGAGSSSGGPPLWPGGDGRSAMANLPDRDRQ